MTTARTVAKAFESTNVVEVKPTKFDEVDGQALVTELTVDQNHNLQTGRRRRGRRRHLHGEDRHLGGAGHQTGALLIKYRQDIKRGL